MANIVKPGVMVLIIVAVLFTANWGVEFVSEVREYQKVSAQIAQKQRQYEEEKKKRHHNWPFTYAEYECVAENVYHEARGEPEEGQRAVVQVTLNRWSESNYKSVCGVIRNSCQFSWVCQDVKRANKKSPQWEKAMSAAVQVMELDHKIPELEDATFYHATYVKPYWASKKVYLKTIGQHKFYR